MAYTVSRIPKSKAKIEAELPAEAFDGYVSSAEQQLGSELKVEGFRPGSVPREIVRREVGMENILMEAARLAIQKTYLEAIEQENLPVIGEPEVEIKKIAPGNPFSFALTVALIPDLELPDYKAIAGTAKRKEVSITDKDVDDTLNWLRKSRVGEGEELPEVTDEFAQSLGSFKDAAQLRSSIQEGLQAEKENEETHRLREEILAKIAKDAKGEIPESLVDREKQGMLENVKAGAEQQLNMKFEEYLQKVQKTEAELADSFAKDAEQRVKKSLVLRQITQQENLWATDQEVEEEINKILKRHPDIQSAEQSIDLEQLKAYTKGVLENEKALQLLESFSQK